MEVLKIEIPLFRRTLDAPRRAIDSDPIAKARIRDVADALALPPEWIKGPGRRGNRRVQLARALVAYTLHRFEGLSYPEIARALGYRNHTSAIYMVRRAEKYYLPEATVQTTIDTTVQTIIDTTTEATIDTTVETTIDTTASESAVA